MINTNNDPANLTLRQLDQQSQIGQNTEVQSDDTTKDRIMTATLFLGGTFVLASLGGFGYGFSHLGSITRNQIAITFSLSTASLIAGVTIIASKILFPCDDPLMLDDPNELGDLNELEDQKIPTENTGLTEVIPETYA